MKKMNKKGFTIVELVIVIAVIAILAAVMIPTFGGIIKKANQSAVEQEVTSAFKEAYALAISDGAITDNNTANDTGDNAKTNTEEYTVGNFTFYFTGSLDEVNGSAVAAADYDKADNYTFEIVKGQLKITAPAN